jgi:hypothetical protein
MLKAKSGKRHPLMRRKGAMPSLTVVIGTPAPPPGKGMGAMMGKAKAKDMEAMDDAMDDDMGDDMDDAEDIAEDEAEAVTLNTLRDEIRALTARLDALESN